MRPHERGDQSMLGSNSLRRLLPHILAEQELIRPESHAPWDSEFWLQGWLLLGRRGVSWGH